MRRTLKLLLLLGIGLVMTRHHGGDPGDSTPATPDGDGADAPRTKTPDGVDAVTDWGGAKEVVTKKLDEGEAKDADGDGTPDIPDTTTGRDPAAGPPVAPDDMLPEARAIADHANERLDEGALDHQVPGVPRDQLPTYVHNVMEGNIDGLETRYGLRNGRTAYYDPETGAVIIEDPGAEHGGTVFVPEEGKDYFDDLV